MSLRAILSLGPAFFRSLRRLPNFLYKVPKTYNFAGVAFRSPGPPQARGILRVFGRFGNTETLAGLIRRSVLAASAPRRPNSLLRTYTGLAGSVHLRNQVIILPNHSYTTVNKLSEPQKKSWFGNFISSFNRVPRLPSLVDHPSPLSPKGILGIGCNSAVWSADLTGLNGKNYELAVKVLYNYYSTPDSECPPASQTTNDDIVDWILLRRQLERECTLRPSSGHPNIVPIIGHFVDRCPGSTVRPQSSEESIRTLTGSNNLSEAALQQPAPTTSQTARKWIGADAFPEGLGGNSMTYYLLMPRFDATLEDLLTGRWGPCENDAIASSNSSSDASSSFIVLSKSSLGSLSPTYTVSSLTETSAERSHRVPLDIDDAIAIAAQLFDAVAELERHGVAHRDIKADNILIRRRIPASTMNTPQPVGSTATMSGLEWLDDREVLATNTRYHVALTDFGCAIRTKDSRLTSYLSEVFGRLLDSETHAEEATSLAHSGNIALLAPEVACPLREASFQPRGSDYFKSDLWAMATLVYPLFGVNNPFIHSTLSSNDYIEADLPQLPEEAPGVVTWVLEQCLKRSPHSRPSADLVADVLHTWSVLRHAHRRQKLMRARQAKRQGEWIGDHDEPLTVDMLEQLVSDSPDGMSPTSASRLRSLLDVSWASDWLTGPARPPDGLRVSFYRRITLNRFAHCLRIVYLAETARAARMADRVSASLPFAVTLGNISLA